MKVLWFPAGSDVSTDTPTLLHDSNSSVGARCGDCVLTLLSTDGLGLPRYKKVTDRSPNQDGVEFKYALAEPREVKLTFALAGDFNGIYEARRAMADWFNPNRDGDFGLGTLRIQHGQNRDIRCRYNSGLQFPLVSGEEHEAQVDLALWAPDPFFHNPTQDSSTFSVADEGNLRFPIKFPIRFGGSSIELSTSLVNEGQLPTNPVATITGPVDYVRFTNVDTNTKIELTYSVPTGSTVVFTPGVNPTVIMDGTTSLLNYLSEDSDLASFEILHNPELAGGVNDMLIRLNGADVSNTQLVFTWNAKYLTS